MATLARRHPYEAVLKRIRIEEYEYEQHMGRPPTHVVLGQREYQALHDTPYLLKVSVKPSTAPLTERVYGLIVVQALTESFLAVCKNIEEVS